MLWVGITGGIGAGKTTVLQRLQTLGHSTISADQLAREVVIQGTPGYTKVVQNFGPGILLGSGEIHRKKLGQAVFGKPEKLKVLEEILHPLIRARANEFKESAKEQGRIAAFYEIPLLFEKDLADQFDKVICVSGDNESLLQRVMDRDGLTRYEVEERLAHQIPIEEKESRSDYVIKNTGDRDQLNREIDNVLAKILKAD